MVSKHTDQSLHETALTKIDLSKSTSNDCQVLNIC